MPPNHGDTANGITRMSTEQFVATTCPGTIPATPNLLLLRDAAARPDRIALDPSPPRHHPPKPRGTGGGDRTRTDDPLLAKQVLSQLSYTPRNSPRLSVVSSQTSPLTTED